jgi:hypothetical protein
MNLRFRQFVEEDIKNWLLGRPDRNYQSLIPPASISPESLLRSLEDAEASGNLLAIKKARDAIEAHGYNIKTLRTLAPKKRRAAK